MKFKVWWIPILAAVLLWPYRGLAGDILTLEESIDIALKNSFTIHYAKEGVESAVARKREAVTGFLPKLNTTYSYTRLNEAPFSRFRNLPTGVLIPSGTEIISGTQNNYYWTFEARQPLFTGGGLVANYQASKIGEDTARIEETAKQQDVVRDVKIAYFNILRAQRIKEAADQSVEMLTAHREIAYNYFKVGMIPKNDLLHAEVELANGRQDLTKAQNAVELAKARFNTVLKRKIFVPVQIVDILQYRPLEKQLDDCLEAALKNRPELKISALKVEQAGKMVRMAQSEYFPTLSLVGNYTRYGDNPSVSGSDYKDAENWSVMGVASWNFWEWGRTKFRVDAGRARENQALDESKELNDLIILEIKHAYLNLQEAEKQIAVSEKVIEQANENFRIAQERFRESVATTTDVLDAETLLTKAKADYANALGDFNINQVILDRAMGIIR
ncbi:MAG: TolC family protein [Syntrophaceae bacterium]|nr:TolC family protein [Syntrophaceae bacterium]